MYLLGKHSIMAAGAGNAVVGHLISMAPEPQPAGAPVVGFPMVSGAPAGSSSRGPTGGSSLSQAHQPARSHGGLGSGTPPNNVGDWIGGALGELSGLLGAAVGNNSGVDDSSAGRLSLDAPPPAFPPGDHPFWRRPDVADKVLYGVSQLHSERCLAVAAAEASSSSLRRLHASVEALQHALEAEQLRCAELEARCGEGGSSGGSGAGQAGVGRVPGTAMPGQQTSGGSTAPGSMAAASAPAAGEVEALRERVLLLQALLADERTRSERTASLAADAAQAGNEAGAAMLAAQLQAEKERCAGLEARLQGWLDSRTATSSEVERLNRALRDRDAQAAEAAQRHARVEAQLRGEIEHVLRQGERRQDDLLTLEAVRHERATAEKAARDAAADVARLQQTLATLRAALKEEQSLRKDLELRLSWDGASGTGGVASHRAGKSSPAPRLGDEALGGGAAGGTGRHPSPATSSPPDPGAASDKAAARLAAAEITRLQDLLAAERKKSVDVALGAARAVAAAKASAAAGPAGTAAPGAGAARPGAPRAGSAPTDAQPAASSAALAAATAAAASATMRAEAAELAVADLQGQVRALLAQTETLKQQAATSPPGEPAAVAALSAEAAAAQMRAEAAAMEAGDLRVQVKALTAKLAGEQALGASSFALRRAESRADGLANALAETQAELARLKLQQSEPASPSGMPPSPTAPRPGGELLRSESNSSLDASVEQAGPRKSGANSARKARMR